MADEGKKKKFVVEEVVGEEVVHSEELEKETKSEDTVETLEETAVAPDPKEEVQEESTETKEDTPEIPKDDLNDTTETSSQNSSTEPVPQVQEQKTNVKLVIVLTAFIALILGGVAGGVLVFISGMSQDSLVAEASPTPVATVAPTSTPAPEVDKQSVTVVIQNGSGIAGEGGRMSQLLTTEGFKVGTVGNASSFDHEETVIQAKDTVDKAFLELLSKTLSEKYKVGNNEKLTTTSSSDIIVIVGSEKAQ